MFPIGEERRLPVFPAVVYLLIAINILVFVQELGAPDPDRFINSFAEIPYDLTREITLAPPSPSWPPLTLFTAMFLHGSILHIASNMLFLFVFGPDIEWLCGHVRFLALYLLAGLAGGVAQWLVDPVSHVPSIGASGAIAGVLGAYIVRFPFARIRTIALIGCIPLLLRIPAALVIGLWAVTQFLHGYGAITHRVASEQGGGIAYFAHIGGFTAGVILVGLLATRALPRAYRYHP